MFRHADADTGAACQSVFEFDAEILTRRLNERGANHVQSKESRGKEWVLAAMKVLVVEDHEDSREVLRNLLERWGYQITPAENLREAVRLMRETTFDVALCDIALPDGDGVVLATLLREDHPNARIIALTGHAEERDRAMRAGCDAFLTKPIDFQELRAALGAS